MLTVRDFSRNKTVPVNFNLLCEGEKGHNYGQKRKKQDENGIVGTKQCHLGQKRQQRRISALCFPLGARGISRGASARRLRSPIVLILLF